MFLSPDVLHSVYCVQRKEKNQNMHSETATALAILVLMVDFAGAQTTTASTTTEKSASIFDSDDLVLINPVESTTLLMGLLACGAILELLFAALRRRPEKFFHTVFESIIEECMLVGILTMILIFISSAGSLEGSWNIMISNSVLVLLYMVVAFALYATITIFWTLRTLSSEKKFERSRMDVDPLLTSTEQLHKECRNFFRASVRINKLTDPSYADVLFMDYIQERSAATLANIYDLSWKSWGVLALFVVGNVIRTRSVISSDTSKAQGIVLNISTFIAIMGVFPVALFLISHWVIRLRLVSLVRKQTDADVNVDTSHVLFFSSVDVTAAVFSVIILLLEWYIAMFFLNMANQAFEEFGPVAVIVVVAALVPPLVFLYFLPWTVINITILSSLGKNIDKDLVQKLRDAAAHGIDFSLLASNMDHSPAQGDNSPLDAKSAKGRPIAANNISIDPMLAGKRIDPANRTTSRSIRGTALQIDDEWDVEHSINLRGSDTESNESEVQREKSGSDSDESDPDDQPLTAAIIDKNYLNDRESVHFTSKQARDAALEAEMKKKTDERWTMNRNWDPLRPMYLPDWRHNPITAREEELKERRSAINAEKERMSLGYQFEL